MSNTYQPDFAIHPGEHLEEALESGGMTQTELAVRLGVHKKTVNEIIRGKAAITSEMALRLGKVFHYPAYLWNNLQRNYDETRARLAEQERLQSHLAWLKQLPLATMIQLGWIDKRKDKTAQLETVLKFFGIASPDQWRIVWETHQVAYHQSQRLDSSALAISVWLRQGEIEAWRIACAPYDRKTFQAALNEARTLSLEPYETFQPKLVEICARAGVAVVFIPELPNTGVFGCTRWFGGKALIQLSLRHKSNDQLWFTFFHEAGHIIKHGRTGIFIEGNALDAEKEEEANVFSRDKLIPPAAYQRFLNEWDGQSLTVIEAFASEIGIAPGIVVGRLQNDKLLPNSHGNRLKIFYEWKA
ncbi:MAG: HigA family addiction module antidote protein [Gammaproteobacteria bacterium]|nr:HigA family addiction module antidote protein [Gammaproteobacteria bacterium]NNJ84335.1 HigA family addiction module antidote protein [Gammaproteobacteria bacterium]